MEIDIELEKPIKSKLLVDTLNLVGIVPFSRKLKVPYYPSENKKNIDENINNAFCELERPKGDYDLIFPLKENIKNYKKYFPNNVEENNFFWIK